MKENNYQTPNSIKTLPHVVIFTDGACKPNPGAGGWAAILRFGNHERIIQGYESATTNNRMELQAPIEALLILSRRCRVDLYVDSTYLHAGVTKWLPHWRTSGWLTSNGNQIKNADLWWKLDGILQKHKIIWHWIKGHAGEPNNERVNLLAQQAMKNLKMD